jgi:hypothetical protein
MAIAFDNAGYNEGTGTGLNGTPLTHTAAGSNRIVFVGMTYQDAATQITAVTYGGVSMSVLRHQTTGGVGQMSTFYLANPATGSQNIAVTTNNNGNWRIGVVSYTGARQAVIPDNVGSGSAFGSSATSTLTSVSNNCWHVMWAASSINSAVTLTAGASTTMRTTSVRGSGFFDGNASITPAGSSTLTGTLSSNITWFAAGATFAPITTITVSDSVSSSEFFLRGRFYSDIIAILTVILKSFDDIVNISEVTLKIRRGFKNIVKAISSWTNSSKSNSSWTNSNKSDSNWINTQKS